MGRAKETNSASKEKQWQQARTTPGPKGQRGKGWSHLSPGRAGREVTPVRRSRNDAQADGELGKYPPLALLPVTSIPLVPHIGGDPSGLASRPRDCPPRSAQSPAEVREWSWRHRPLSFLLNSEPMEQETWETDRQVHCSVS